MSVRAQSEGKVTFLQLKFESDRMSVLNDGIKQSMGDCYSVLQEILHENKQAKSDYRINTNVFQEVMV